MIEEWEEVLWPCESENKNSKLTHFQDTYSPMIVKVL